MDPMSVASLGLGAVSLPFQVFAGCIKGYQLLCDAAELPKEYRHLQTRLNMQREDLLAWSQVAGLVNEDGLMLTMSLRLNRALLMDILSEISYLLDNFGKVNGRYKNLQPVPAIESAVAAGNGTITMTANKEQVVPGGKSEHRFVLRRARDVALRAADAASSAPKKLRWASFDREAFQKLLDRLSEFNTFMKSLMDESQGRELLRTQRQTLMSTLQLHNSMDELKRLISALATSSTINVEADHSPDRTRPSSLAEASAFDEGSILDLAEFKRLNLDSDHGSSRAMKTEIKFSSITLSVPNPEMERDASPLETRVEAVYRDFRPNPNIVTRVQHLAVLLQSRKPATFRVPECCGYFDDGQDDGQRFGFVFANPAGVPPLSRPVSLLSRIQTTQRPSLTDRITLAKKIANCLCYLHSVNWLHKGLRSDNIIFFPDDAGHVDYAKPYLTGFDYARPARAGEFTEKPPLNPEYDIYRHPRAVGRDPEKDSSSENPFKKIYDIYSLGVILMQIGEWRSIDRTVRLPADGVQKELLHHERIHLTQLRSSVGDVYYKIVERCLMGGRGFGIEDEENDANEGVGRDLQEAFYERVIEKMESLNL